MGFFLFFFFGMAAINGEEQERMDLFFFMSGWVVGQGGNSEKLGFVFLVLEKESELGWWGQWNQVMTHTQ